MDGKQRVCGPLLLSVKLNTLIAKKTGEKNGQTRVNRKGKTGATLMTGANQSSLGQYPMEEFARRCEHPWGVIRPATEAKIGCINVTTLGQERGVRDVIANEELIEYAVDVCGISETKWKGKGTQDMGDYKLFYSGVDMNQDAYGVWGYRLRKTWLEVFQHMVW